MRLIDTTSLEMCEVGETLDYPYAILSHRWEDGEVNFPDFQQKDHGRLRNRKGYIKIRNFCELARSRGFRWAWVDTCCIDKSSSSELSEAINSMYDWYRLSDFCCVYLADVRNKDDFGEFRRSSWFKRGWTLQELLAPEQPEFFTCDWTFIGTRKSLSTYISSATRIPLGVFYNRYEYPLHRYSIAQKMSWAAYRETTRSEDLAYCLLGLFNVNMPLLYGEGSYAAFKRLQFEIIKISNDESLFAWSEKPGKYDTLLAASPVAFAADGDVTTGSPLASARPYSVSNQGLRIKMHIRPISSDIATDIAMCNLLDFFNRFAWADKMTTATYFVAPLHCSRDRNPLCLLLRKESEDLLKMGIRFLPDGTQLSEFSLEKVSLNVHHEVSKYFRLNPRHINIPPSLHLLGDELKSQMGRHVPSNIWLDSQQYVKDGTTEVSSFDPNGYDVLDFAGFLWHQNRLNIVLKSDDSKDRSISLPDFESALLNFVRPRSWVESFLKRLEHECTLLRK